ncbi:salicylate synthase [Corynebacterium bovis]|nr:salicylate synthase [Corynebacterium bovis]RRO86043.1 salicylate synthase [Corynebacterium bovis]RRQ13956.1 salicylate synthase [Corynebacterium bovis]RRQ15109.1 salicylate synthase [Corynebacterium bovis]
MSAPPLSPSDADAPAEGRGSRSAGAGLTPVARALADAAARARDDGALYAVYEDAEGGYVGRGERARVVLTDDGAHVTVGDTTLLLPGQGSPVPLLRRAVAEVEERLGGDAAAGGAGPALGWVGTEWAMRHHGIGRHGGADTGTGAAAGAEGHARTDAGEDPAAALPLAVLRWPETVERITADPATVPVGGPAAEGASTPGTADPAPDPTPSPVDVSGGGDAYRATVTRAVEEIRAGRYEKVIISRRVTVPGRPDIPATYRAGRAANSPARSFAFEWPELSAAGFSPEIVVSVDADGLVTTEPLAGTRALTGDPEEDRRLHDDLVTDDKEIAEHCLSVRDAMEEVGSVCDGARVDEFMAVRRRGSVQHLASTVRGRLAGGRDRFDALGVLFPAVTASGIPKREALDAVHRLEPVARGMYAGAFVVLGADGSLETALSLRTVYATDRAAWVQAGAGIVRSSRPEREFTETCEKLGSVAPYVVVRG